MTWSHWSKHSWNALYLLAVWDNTPPDGLHQVFSYSPELLTDNFSTTYEGGTTPTLPKCSVITDIFFTSSNLLPKNVRNCYTPTLDQQSLLGLLSSHCLLFPFPIPPCSHQPNLFFSPFLPGLCDLTCTVYPRQPQVQVFMKPMTSTC